MILFFRSQNLSFNNESFITTSPFLDINSKFNIEELDSEIVKNINIEKLLSSKEIIKKFNIKNEINFVAKKFTNNLIDKLNFKMNLAYGRMNFEKI